MKSIEVLHLLRNKILKTAVRLGLQGFSQNEAKEWIAKEAVERVVSTQSELAADASERFGVSSSRQSVSVYFSSISLQILEVQWNYEVTGHRNPKDAVVFRTMKEFGDGQFDHK
jgi:hypothetical protein